ncbi:hypothetical protein QAD02_005637 [Eretmocerus hayati]|uniref:Uncharacterized protein n=1 Tax=Eretmocerus hayati TaxID=131215 RepID=A0ACC2NT50_9HYME|nr:hypothetical protein QAD02_005637 [Eretmocerus hayati]
MSTMEVENNTAPLDRGPQQNPHPLQTGAQPNLQIPMQTEPQHDGSHTMMMQTERPRNSNILQTEPKLDSNIMQTEPPQDSHAMQTEASQDSQTVQGEPQQDSNTSAETPSEMEEQDELSGESSYSYEESASESESKDVKETSRTSPVVHTADYRTYTETVVSITHKSSNFAYQISLEVPEVKLEDFPEETFKFNAVLKRACLYCYSQIDNRDHRKSSSDDESENENGDSAETCLCTGRHYTCKLLFKTNSDCVENDYSYKVSARLVSKTNRDISLFSHVFRKTHLLETLDDVCLKDKSNIEYSKITEIRFDISRERINKEFGATFDPFDFYSQLLSTDPCSETAVLKVAEKSFTVSKKILSSKSTVFEKIFACKAQGKKPKVIKIEDFDADAIETMLLFIYTDKVKDIHKNYVEVFKAAHKYEIKGLMERCMEWIKFNINRSNFVAISRLVSSYNLNELLDMVIKYEKSFIFSLVIDEEYQDFLLNSLKLDTVVHTLKICDEFSASLSEVEKKVFDYVKDNMPDIVGRDDFQSLFKDNHNLIKKLFTYLHGNNNTKKRKLSDSLDSSQVEQG